MANQCNVVVLEEVLAPQPDGWALCFQWCQYQYADRRRQHGYRFIWRWPAGNLQAARGQARIPSLRIMRQLTDAAEEAGWGDKAGEGSSELSL